MRRLRAADACYLGTLLVLPLAGVGLVRLLVGRDLGAGLQPAYLLLAAAWAVRLADLARPGSRDRARLLADPGARSAGRWLALGALVVALSVLGLWLQPAPLLRAEAWPRYLRQVVQLAIMVAFLLYPLLWTRGPRRWQATSALLAAAVLLEVGYAVLQGLHVWRPLPAMAALERVVTSNPAVLAGSEQLYLGGFTGIPRLRGTMLEPLYLGSFLVGAIPWLVLGRRRWLALAAAAVLVLTWSRAAWLAAGAAAMAWWWARRWAQLPGPGRRVWFALGLAAAAVALAALAVGGLDLLLLPLRRLLQTADTSDWSNLTRFYSLQAAWRAFLASPVVGVGWGQFPFHFYALVDLPGLESQFTWPVVNSMPALVLCETGLVGLAALVAAVASLVRRTARALAGGAPPAARARLAAAAAAGTGVGFQLLMFSQYNLPHLWVVPGLWLAALAEVESRREGGRP